MKKFLIILIGFSISVFLLLGVYILYRQTYPGNSKDSEITLVDTSTIYTEEVRKTEIILAGDVMLGRSVMIAALEEGNYLYPFANVLETLRNADIVFFNLESPIVNDCPVDDSGYKFCTTPEIAKGLSSAGVDIVTLANNHSGNYGEDGLDQTVIFLHDNGIDACGLGDLEIIEKNGLKFGFLGFDYTLGTPKEGDFDLTKTSSGVVDILIVGIHWGVEYTGVPTEKQRSLAKKFIDSGASVISGHHPHWVQEIEYLDGKPVYYSLGNFVFDQMWSEETKKGLIVKLTFEGKKIINEERLPIYTYLVGQPSLSK